MDSMISQFSSVVLLLSFFVGLHSVHSYQLPSNQGILVKIAQESWKLTYKRLVSELAPQSRTGAYDRPAAQFLGSQSQIVLQDQGRYHLYLGNPCPWCHRVAITYTILGLSCSSTEPKRSPLITMSQLEDDPLVATKGGWIFSSANPDPLFRANDLKAVYDLLSPGYTGKITAPLLIDKKSRKIVSNESKDIVRLLGSHKFARIAQDPLCTDLKSTINLRPKDLSTSIDAKNEWLYKNFNNAVYRSGFATEQGPYDEAVAAVAAALVSIESTLSRSKFMHGESVTESDIFLLPTVVRFDAIYSVLFKCTGKRISDFKHIQRWVKDMYLFPGVRETFDLKDAARSYYQQMFPLNPSRIIPLIIIPPYMEMTE